MRRVFWTAVLTGLFLFMLSALVVAPETACAPPETDLSPDFHAMFRPLISALPPDAADVPASRSDPAAVLCTLAAAMTVCALLSCACDANGRVLSAVRYENSVYQLFRPEVAGG